ncbi:hypothetical protein NDU88_001346 [Pleurodeles waltl]|uniref:Uncharacterized protein n=1 Tax=Pleurodeles waltl TaxID=8319 RepID=A0AAV7LCW2_PLEWA|nr:hypothetical protein NDU88_001346 [Pleurodeles waltl]
MGTNAGQKVTGVEAQRFGAGSCHYEENIVCSPKLLQVSGWSQAELLSASPETVRRALLRAEPELPRSRLWGARAGGRRLEGREEKRRRSGWADATAALEIYFGYLNK